jgi:hypothetical protein
LKRQYLTLVVIIILSLLGVLLDSEDPIAREVVCAHTGVCPVPHAKALEKIAYELSIGALISLIFYGLLVWWPEYDRRRRLRRSLERHYRDFRSDCIEIMLMVADGSLEGDLAETLMDQKKFRSYFEESVAHDRNRWHDFQNNIDEYYLRQLLINMEILRVEIT